VNYITGCRTTSGLPRESSTRPGSSPGQKALLATTLPALDVHRAPVQQCEPVLRSGACVATPPVEALRQLFMFEQRPNLMPRYYIAPTQDVPIAEFSDPTTREKILATPGSTGLCTIRIFRAIARENAGCRYLGAVAFPLYQPGCVIGRW
jgi:hypothetical protein